jgi:hypothetical protein
MWTKYLAGGCVPSLNPHLVLCILSWLAVWLMPSSVTALPVISYYVYEDYSGRKPDSKQQVRDKPQLYSWPTAATQNHDWMLRFRQMMD